MTQHSKIPTVFANRQETCLQFPLLVLLKSIHPPCLDGPLNTGCHQVAQEQLFLRARSGNRNQ
jgi:hypothetical protein